MERLGHAVRDTSGGFILSATVTGARWSDPPLNIPFDGYSGPDPVVGSRGGRKQFHLDV